MNRENLLEKLELVKPAVSSINLVPVLAHFWFRNDTLSAYNDQIAISTKLVSGFEGAVPDTLVSILSASRAKEVEFLPKENELTVKAASSKIKLPFLDAKATEIFTMPQPDPKKALPVDIQGFLQAVDTCMGSLREDTSIPDSLGITLAIKDGMIDLFATNDSTISTAVVKLKTNLEESRVVISGDFCRQMTSIAKKYSDEKKHLEIHDDYSLFQCGDITLFGRLIDVPRPLDFESVIESSYPKVMHKKAVQVPTKLELILDRAIVITDSKQDRPKTNIKVKDGVANFYSASSDRGEVRDVMQLEGHPDVEVNIDPRLFRCGYGSYDKILLTEQCLIMSRGSNLYLVSASH